MPIRLNDPGEHLAEELKELHMSAAELARNWQVAHISHRLGNVGG
jgi:hypothetical protein